MVLVTDASVGRVLGGAQIVPEKNRESFLLSKNVCWCWLRMLLLAEYVPATMLDPKALATAQIVPEKNRESFPLSENVFWCWLRMLLLAEYWGVLK